MKLLLCLFLLFSLSIFAKESSEKSNPRLDKKVEKSAPTCVQLGTGCMICTDGKKRKSVDAKEDLKLSDYECAKDFKVEKKKSKELAPAIALKLKECIVVSDFCAVCKDGTFASLISGRELQADLYECATSPRTKWGE